ncbi:MAG TPA: Mur ligase family protein, partial [Candidatus Methanoperedens sp.]|nr:Mur ligase family protein [Candidatus Methanoperedens sp.]
VGISPLMNGDLIIMKIIFYKEALEYLHQSIPKGKLRFPGELGLERQKFLLKCLGNPQNKYRVIHIAGTSGKGSTASYLSYLIEKHGFKVGLTVSPHILDIKERVQINNRNISESDFVLMLNKVIPAVEMAKKVGLGEPTYFEIMVTMFFYAFYYFKVDFAVVETGMGGTFDGSNVVTSENKLAVITRLGLDHTGLLGNTIAKIAWHKAGIIQEKNMVISRWQNKNVREVLERRAREKGSKILYVKGGENYKNIKLKNEGIVYDFRFEDLEINEIFLKTLAIYQVENSAMALGALKLLSKFYKFSIDINIVKKTLADFTFLGRMNTFKKLIKGEEKTIVFDGAHNPQKMRAFVESLKRSFLQKKITFVVAFKQKKEAKKMMQKIVPLANKIILTSFVVEDQDMVAVSRKTDYLVKILDSINYKNYKVVANPEMAVEEGLRDADLVAVTGSLYLLCKIKKWVKEN